MAASATMPKLLDHISNEEYQEKDEWKIDDIALGPANELLISGHNLEIPKTFISMYKEDSGKYGNRPEFNRNFRQPHPGEQLVLFLEGSSIIGLKVESALRLVSIGDMGVLKTLNWKWSPTCVCFYRGKLYAASSSSTIVSVCNLDSEEKRDIFLSDMRSDSVLDIVVVMEKLYVCTKFAGRALVFSMTGSKEIEFKNPVQTDAMATCICIHERTELVFVLWNNIQIQLYSQTSRCLLAFDMTEKLHKIRVTTENILVTLSASKCIVSVYDVGAVIGESEKNILTLVKKKHRKILMSHGEENLECHSANSETPTTLSIPLKPASKQSNFEKLRDTDELHLKQLEERKNLRRKSDRDVQKLKESTKVPEGMIKETKSQQKKLKDKLEDEKGKVTREERSCVQLNENSKDLEDIRTELESQQKAFKDSLVEEKRKLSREERSRVQVETKLKKVEERNTKLEDEVKQLKERLLAEESISKEVQTSSLKVDTKLKKVEERNTKLEDEVKQLKERLLAEESLSKEVQTSSLKLNDKIKELEGTIKELECQQKKLKSNLEEEEEEKVTHEERSRVQAENALEKSENMKLVLEKKIEEKDRRMLEEQRKVKEQKKFVLSVIRQAETSRKSLEKTKAMLEKEKKDLNKQLAAEQGKGKDMKESLSQAKTSIEKLTKAKVMLQKEKEELNKQLSAEKRKKESPKAALSKNLITSLHQVRSVINDNMDNISEYSPEVNQPDPEQRKQNNDNQERRRNSRRTRERRSALTPMIPKRQSREKMGTPVEKMQQEEIGYTTDSTTDNESSIGYETASEFKWERALSPGSAAKIKHDEPGITTDPTTDHEEHQGYGFDDTSDTDTVKWDSDEEEVLDGQSKLEVCARVSVEGANLKIAETGVSLYIPPGALSEEQTILMKIIPQPCDAKSALKFECNSVVVVELLPNNCRFQCPVSLTLPHCLQLKEEYERNSVDVLISHHDEGLKPKWEILHDAKFYLLKENCTLYLHSFCWVTYEIHDTIVEAKRIKLYTAGKKMRLNDRIAEVEVGFYPDLPGSGKILELNKDMHLSQRKPYVFLKAGEEPLLINLHKVVPKQWNNSQPDENPKIIPFDSVSISEERSCPFVLERSGDDIDIPLCIFKVGQKGRNEVELTIRPDVLTA